MTSLTLQRDKKDRETSSRTCIDFSTLWFCQFQCAPETRVPPSSSSESMSALQPPGCVGYISALGSPQHVHSYSLLQPLCCSETKQTPKPVNVKPNHPTCGLIWFVVVVTVVTQWCCGFMWRLFKTHLMLIWLLLMSNRRILMVVAEPLESEDSERIPQTPVITYTNTNKKTLNRFGKDF